MVLTEDKAKEVLGFLASKTSNATFVLNTQHGPGVRYNTGHLLRNVLVVVNKNLRNSSIEVVNIHTKSYVQCLEHLLKLSRDGFDICAYSTHDSRRLDIFLPASTTLDNILIEMDLPCN